MSLLQKFYLYSFCNPLKIFLYHLEPFGSYFFEVTIWLENRIEKLEYKYSSSNILTNWSYLIYEFWVDYVELAKQGMYLKMYESINSFLELD